MWSEGYSRYETSIAEIFKAEQKLRYQLNVEVALAKVQEELGMIPTGCAKEIEIASNNVKLERVLEIENEIHHDLMAMVKALAEKAGSAGEYVHYTATSMDIQDTVLALQMTKAKEVILDEVAKVKEILRNLVQNYKNFPCVGRTHGQFAVPTTVGFKFANFLFELDLASKNLVTVPTEYAKISGAVGNYASSMRMDLEEKVLASLGLKPVPISTQVVTRLVHSRVLFALAQIGAVLERISKEVRHLQRSEIGEWFEPRSKKQVGSSAMPHKRNPHKSERINGLARVLRSNVMVGLENIALEHERDLTNSSPERLVIPENFIVLHYMLQQTVFILSGLEINEKNIKRNLDRAAVSRSEQILKLLVDKVGRQTGHELLRRHVDAENFRESVLSDEKITELIPKDQLVKIFDEINVGLAPDKCDYIIQNL